jgi:nuclear factor I
MFKTFIFIFLCCQDAKQFYLGLPHHATLGPATTYYASPVESGGPHSPSKYHENGHDTFSDFVTLVCQEAQSTSGSQGGGQIHPGHSRSPLSNNNNNGGGGKQGGPPTYYSTTSAMFPPPPPAPMARPVTIIRSTGKKKLLSSFRLSSQ